MSRNLDSNNGWHEVIDDDLADLLDRVGVYREKFKAVAESGWLPEQIQKLAEIVLDERGPGEGGAVFIWRLFNLPKPPTDHERRRKYIESKYDGVIQH